MKDRNGGLSDFVLDNLSKEIHDVLRPIVNTGSILCSDDASAYKTFAKEHNIKHYRPIVSQNTRIIGGQSVNNYMSRLRAWMARFHGVGTEYLQNHLGWKRMTLRGGCTMDPIKKRSRQPMDLAQAQVPQGQVYVIPERCKECNYCVSYCPEQVLSFSEDINIKGYHYPVVTEGKEAACIHCGFCDLICPELAIYTVEVIRTEPLVDKQTNECGG